MKTYVVCGLGFGDEGKGHTVAWLTKTRQATTIIRYNGGPQAAHHVVHQGQTHLFAQFGAGMVVSPHVKTLLSQQMVIQPFSLLREAEVHQNNGLPQPLQRLKIDSRCPIVTPWHKLINRAREISRGQRRLGSVGIGVGETFHYQRQFPEQVITAGDLIRPQQLAEKAHRLHRYTIETLQSLPDSAELAQFLSQHTPTFQPTGLIQRLAEVGQTLAPCLLGSAQGDDFLGHTLTSETTILEGAQGTLLDYHFGTRPYVTKTGTRCAEATKLLDPFSHTLAVTYLGVSRPYLHRHGPGPLPTEAPHLLPHLADRHNGPNQWQGPFRVGWFDAVLAGTARDLNPELDYVVVTNLDRLTILPRLKYCTRYASPPAPTETWTDYLFRASPVYETMTHQAVIPILEAAYRAPILAVSAGEENAWTEL